VSITVYRLPFPGVVAHHLSDFQGRLRATTSVESVYFICICICAHQTGYGGQWGGTEAPRRSYGFRLPGHPGILATLPDESRYGEKEVIKCVWFMFNVFARVVPLGDPTPSDGCCQMDGMSSRRAFASCFFLSSCCQLPLFGTSVSLITRSFVFLCIPCWLSATRIRSIWFSFCLLRLMYWYRRPQIFRWYLLP
jgi:hypothetical protein